MSLFVGLAMAGNTPEYADYNYQEYKAINSSWCGLIEQVENNENTGYEYY